MSIHGSNECLYMELEWTLMSLAELVVVFAVDDNCQLLRKDTGIPQHVLFVLSLSDICVCTTYSIGEREVVSPYIVVLLAMMYSLKVTCQ